jgi:Ca2+-transporting ATPase
MVLGRDAEAPEVTADAAASVGASPRAWHALSVDAALTAAQSRESGLSDAEARARLDEYGPNRLAPPAPVSALRILRDQLTGVVVILLLVAALVSLALGDRLEAAAIGVVLAINTLIGFSTEWRARRAMEALLELDVPRASVIREGQLQLIDAHVLVPGDVVETGAGHRVPADARLLSTIDLRVTEAALTGESLPVSKHAVTVLAADTQLADRVNMIYKGTTVAAGTGRAVVVATGAATEVGRIGTLVGSMPEEETPLERRLDALGRRLVWLTLIVAGVVSALGAVQGVPLGLVVETGIALAVAAVPEALPAVATISLAIGMRRMARRHALVRRLPAVETLGSTTVVCTDKTRTLTSGEMSIVRAWTAGREIALGSDAAPEDAGLIALLQTAARASRQQAADHEPAPQTDANQARGSLVDPVDRAVLQAFDRATGHGASGRIDAPVAVIPFSSDRKFMAAFHRLDGLLVASVKGAPRRVLDASSTMAQTGELTFAPARVTPIDGDVRASLVAVNDRFAAAGLRVLAVATGPADAAAESALHDLTFVGFIGLADPPAAGVKETIARLRGAGLRTVMLTGDQRLTAETIGRELGVLGPEDLSLDGRELDALQNAERDAIIARTQAFSRVTPEHKLVIVGALQARGEIVAMLGDGTNDAAALKKADVGVAMGGRGTDVAKEAAAIVLQDDRFETIAAAVEEGRIIFDNIRKFVFYLFSCNVAEVLVLLVAGLAGLPLPLAPLQLLWLNMATDTFPALALAIEPGDVDIMRRPPQSPQEAILSRAFLGRVFGFGLLITVSTLAAFVWALGHAPDDAPTIAFMTLAFAQIGHLGNARSRGPVLRVRRALANPYAIVGAGIAVLLQLAAAGIAPLAHVLRVMPLEPLEWLVILVLASIPAVVGQIIKVGHDVGKNTH